MACSRLRSVPVADAISQRMEVTVIRNGALIDAVMLPSELPHLEAHPVSDEAFPAGCGAVRSDGICRFEAAEA